MGYCIHLYATSKKIVAFSQLLGSLFEDDEDVTFECLAGPDKRWIQLELSHKDGRGIALVEREPLKKASAVRGIENFLGLEGEEEEEHKPASAVKWLREQAERVQSLYLLRVEAHLSRDRVGAFAIDLLLNNLHDELGGFVYADLEGFYIHHEEHAWQITWEPELSRIGPTGKRGMAVLDGDEWVLFTMDAADPTHLAAFRRGEVPAGVVPGGRLRRA
jgi:hypothetical protein